MGTSRRALICALAVAALWPTTARAQAFPNRPIRLIVPFAAGGAADLFGRALANALSAELGQQVVVEVRAGAGGLTGVDALAKSAPDGYTICLAGAAALSAIPFMVSKMPFDWRKDLALLTLAVRVPEVLIVHPALGVDTLDDFIAYARAHPGKINFGSAGAGSITHLAGRIAQARDRHQSRARSLSRRRSRGGRHARRAHPADRGRRSVPTCRTSGPARSRRWR